MYIITPYFIKLLNMTPINDVGILDIQTTNKYYKYKNIYHGNHTFYQTFPKNS